MAALQNQRDAGVDDESRASLIDRIEFQKTAVARTQQRQADLTARTQSLQRRLGDLTTQTQATTLADQRLAAVTGFGAVSGPGIRVTIEQAADADANGQVKPLDLANVINGLFEAGAEAVSVNGQRLTARSAVLSSGPAIEVNDTGIAPPYVVSAIGDQRTLQARLFDTTSGLDFATVADRYGIGYSVDQVDSLNLPGAPTSLRTLRSARVAPDASDDDRPASPRHGRDIHGTTR